MGLYSSVAQPAEFRPFVRRPFLPTSSREETQGLFAVHLLRSLALGDLPFCASAFVLLQVHGAKLPQRCDVGEVLHQETVVEGLHHPHIAGGARGTPVGLEEFFVPSHYSDNRIVRGCAAVQANLEFELLEYRLCLFAGAPRDEPLAVAAGPVGQFPHDLAASKASFVNRCHGPPLRLGTASASGSRDWRLSRRLATDRCRTA